MTACLLSLCSVCCTLCGVHREEVQQAMAAGGMDEVEEALAQLQEQVGVPSFTSTTKLHTQRYAWYSHMGPLPYEHTLCTAELQHEHFKQAQIPAHWTWQWHSEDAIALTRAYLLHALSLFSPALAGCPRSCAILLVAFTHALTGLAADADAAAAGWRACGCCTRHE